MNFQFSELIKDKEILKKLKDKKFDVAISETFELTGMCK